VTLVGAAALAAGLLSSACLMVAQPASPPTFDGQRAFDHLRRIVAIGPRPAGSPAAARTREYITRELAALGITAVPQAFEADTPVGTIPMVNLRATIPGRVGSPRLLIGGHYDTKLFDDITFVGANDGGSSTAFLLELARVLTGRPAGGLPIELVFFDGEEAVVEWEGTDNTYGSRHYVRAAERDGTLKEIGALVLVDMIGDRDLRILREAHSTPWLTDIIWAHARKLGRTEFVDDSTAVLDDHVPFLQAGVPAVNIIDMDYDAWHTAADDLDRVAPESLQVVGDVLVSALPDIEAALVRRAGARE
jgi:glutaminyl-peptide cyclotransferase